MDTLSWNRRQQTRWPSLCRKTYQQWALLARKWLFCLSWNEGRQGKRTPLSTCITYCTDAAPPEWFCQEAAGPVYLFYIIEFELAPGSLVTYNSLGSRNWVLDSSPCARTVHFFWLGVVWWSLAIVSSDPPSNFTCESNLSWNEIDLRHALTMICFLSSLWWTPGRKKIMFKCEVVNCFLQKTLLQA